MSSHLHFQFHSPSLRHARTSAAWALAGLTITAFFAPVPTEAANGIWTGQNGNFGATANWQSGTVGQGIDAVADFSQVDFTANRTINLNANRIVGTLILGDTNTVDTATRNLTFTPSGAFTLTLQTNAGTPLINTALTGQTTTITAPIAGTQGFTKSGAGTLLLSNAANTLTGGISLGGGTLSLISGGLGSNVVTATANSTLAWDSDHTQDVSGLIKVGDGVTLTLTLSGIAGTNTTFATPLQTGASGTGKIVKGAASTLTITAANTYTGGTTVNNGRLILSGGSNRLAAAGAVILGNGANSGVLQLGDAIAASNQTVTSLTTSGSGTANSVVGGFTSASTLTVNNATNVTFAGVLGGAGTNDNQLALAKTGAGNLTLSGNSSFTGDVNIGSGALIATSSTALGAGAKTVTISGTTTAPSLQLNKAGGVSLPATFSYVTSNDNATTPALVNTAGANLVGGSFALADTGFGGTQTRVKVNAGSLTLTGGIAPAITAATDRTLILDGAADGLASGVLADQGAIKLGVTKEGAGTWTLSGANSYGGPTQINGGRLNLTTAQTGAGALALASGATLGVSLAAAGQSFAPAALTLNGTNTIAFNLGGFSNPSAPVINTGVFTITGANSLTVAGTGLGIGSFPLIKYTGALAGVGFAGLPAGTLPSSAVPARVTANLVDDSANSQVLLNVTAFDVPKWTGATDGNWDVNDGPDPTTGAGTVNWRETGSLTPTRYLQSGSTVDSVLFNDSATGVSTVNLAAGLSPTSITVDNTTRTYTFGGAGNFAGATPLLKKGTGTLVLANTVLNTQTGTVTIAAGTLQVGDGATTGGGSLGAGNVVDDATLELNRPDDFSIANVISGSGTIVKKTANVATLSGSNAAFAGVVQVTAGTLKLGNANALGTTGAGTQVAAGAALDITGFAIAEPIQLSGGTLRAISGAASSATGGITLVAGGSLDAVVSTTLAAGAISGVGPLTKSGAGTIIFTGANSYTGGTILSQGTLQVGATGGGGTIGSLGAGAIDLAPALGNTATLTVLRGDSTFELTNAITSSGAGTNAVIIGATGATSPSGTVTFSGTNTFTGNVTINGGALRITNSDALGGGTKLVRIGSNAGPALKIAGSAGNIALPAGINFAISSDGTIVNTASNAGAIVNTGGDNVIGGKISLINGGGGQGRVSVQAGSLTINGDIDADTATGGRTLLLGGAGAGTVNGVISDFNSTATSAVSVQKDGAGAWTLTGQNSFTGTIAAQAGTLKVNFVDAIGNAQPLGTAASAVTLGTASLSATLEYSGSTATLERPITVTANGPGSVVRNSGGGVLTLPGPITKTGTKLTLTGGAFDVTGVIAGTAANSDLLIDGGVTTLSAANTYNGATSVRGGAILKLGTGNALPAGTTLTLGEATNQTGATLDLNGFDQTISSLAGAGSGVKVVTNGAASGTSTLTVSGAGSFDGAIADGATAKTALTKSGTGTFTIAGAASSYTGPTVVTGGTLEIAGSLSGTTEIHLMGGTLLLTGSDRINSLASVQLGGGTLVADDFSEGDAATPGLGLLVLNANSTIDFGIGTGSVLSFAGLGAHNGGTLSITNWSGVPYTPGSAADDRLLFAGNADDFRAVFEPDDISINGSSGYAAIQFDPAHFEIVAVPEPSSTSLLGSAALLGLAGLRERRRLQQRRSAQIV